MKKSIFDTVPKLPSFYNFPWKIYRNHDRHQLFSCLHLMLSLPFSVKNKSRVFTVWVPALADLTLVLMNMGVAFVTLFPFENLQPAFTEGDLL